MCGRKTRKNKRRMVNMYWKGEDWWCEMSDGTHHCDDCHKPGMWSKESHQWGPTRGN